MTEIFLDTETTGLSVHDRHRIVEIACVETKDLLATKRVFHKIINPQRSVPEEAFRVHGFSTEFLKDKETFDKVAEEFLEFMKVLDLPDIYDCISKWELIEEKGHHTSFHENIRTYYDHMLKYPAGFLPCGDSFGRINPIFGQGMSIAALESEILQKTISEVKDLKTLTSLYLKRIGCFFDIPWFLVNCEDWRYPNVPGRSKEIKYINWFTGKLHKLCAKDKQIVSEMYNVLHLNKRPLALFKPSIVLKALFKRA